MYSIVVQELVEATSREREEDALRGRVPAVSRRRRGSPLRRRLARSLVRAGLRLDGDAGEATAARCR